jgi:hypothetical protein
MGYSALEAGVRMLPVAVGMVAGSRISIALVQRLGTKLVVAAGLAIVAAALGLLSTAQVESGYELLATAMTFMGLGLALAMAPATEAIMGSLPAAKAGVGSAVNDVVREVGGTIGVAILGSILAGSYEGGMDGAAAGLEPDAAAVATDSVGGAHEVAAGLGGETAAQLVSAADHAFIDAMTTTTGVAAVVALLGAAVALAFLPARARQADAAPGGERMEVAMA